MASPWWPCSGWGTAHGGLRPAGTGLGSPWVAAAVRICARATGTAATGAAARVERPAGHMRPTIGRNRRRANAVAGRGAGVRAAAAVRSGRRDRAGPRTIGPGPRAGRPCRPAGSVRSAGRMERPPRRRPEARCPIRPGEPCTLCVPGVTGPHDCGLVYLVMHDDELRDGVHEARARARR
jgi:hypothetical protein